MMYRMKFENNPGFTQVYVTCAMKIKKEEKQLLHNFFDERKNFIRLYQKNG